MYVSSARGAAAQEEFLMMERDSACTPTMPLPCDLASSTTPISRYLTQFALWLCSACPFSLVLHFDPIILTQVLLRPWLSVCNSHEADCPCLGT
ncbi:hypothetical protein Y1Q_0011550 [Alligator mississippiensis]|uniref:Uncharacterized protein n=1 Tax=Alligator mississippiensis TaxID=8496 RepID=A0A151M059_ALLMI|nr:hypothetical protein Y1Q_0011550 [Alligator mississippiensis]